MEIEEKKKYLKKAFWDRQISGDELLAILEKRMEASHDVTLPKLYVRLLETYNWYTILNLISYDQRIEIVSEKFTNKIWNKPIRTRFEYARRLLSK
ncbi:MAG: hypothetical protein EAZ53_08905 [Bacteroidetes bacterium]|nr:MAG: hypothetical protein EAZ53_08905 [Bacteroidota bacterium]